MKRSFLLIVVAVLSLVACTTPVPTETPLETPAALVIPDTTPGSAILQTLLDFCMDSSIFLILGLCALDVVFGVSASLRSGVFDWRKVGQFYKTQVLSLLLPYVAVLVVLAVVPAVAEWLPVAMLPGAMLTGILGTVGGSLIANAQALRKPSG